jgi:anti-sigma B factor antagonist
MEFQTKTEGKVLVIKPLVKKITSLNSGEFRDDVQKMIDGGSTNIIINMSSVEYMDSSGLGSIATIFKYLEDKAKLRSVSYRMALCSLQTSVVSIYSIFHMAAFIPYYGDEAEALNTF